MPASLTEQISATAKTFQALLQIEPQINAARDLVLKTIHAGGKLIVCGNGGSAAEASHLATELTGRYSKNRKSLAAITLSADGSLMSCIGNDYGFDEVFARGLEGLGRPEDLLITFTSSGNSANILKVLEKAKAMNIPSISFLGRNGGKAKGLGTIDLIVPGDSGRTAQEAHLFLIHYICEAIDEAVIK